MIISLRVSFASRKAGRFPDKVRGRKAPNAGIDGRVFRHYLFSFFLDPLFGTGYSICGGSNGSYLFDRGDGSSSDRGWLGRRWGGISALAPSGALCRNKCGIITALPVDISVDGIHRSVILYLEAER